MSNQAADQAADDPATPSVRVRTLSPDEATRAIPRLAALLVDAVASGASVNFMAGFSQTEAEAFWHGQMDGIRAGQRLLLVAETDGAIMGTVIVRFASQPNQQHRADVNKMLVDSRQRRRGIGRRLLDGAEAAAHAAGRTLLVLDTETGSSGHRLYAATGWVEVGTIPGYALSPDGHASGATIFYKTIGTL